MRANYWKCERHSRHWWARTWLDSLSRSQENYLNAGPQLSIQRCILAPVSLSHLSMLGFGLSPEGIVLSRVYFLFKKGAPINKLKGQFWLTLLTLICHLFALQPQKHAFFSQILDCIFLFLCWSISNGVTLKTSNCLLGNPIEKFHGNRVGEVVRAFYQCSLVSISGVIAVCALSFLALCSKRLLSGYSDFPSDDRPTFYLNTSLPT